MGDNDYYYLHYHFNRYNTRLRYHSYHGVDNLADVDDDAEDYG